MPAIIFAQDIVGGNDVDEGKYPFMAGIVESKNVSLYNGFECGATLIAPTWVMTAAHCVDGQVTEDLTIVLGTVNLSQPSQTTRRVKVKRVVIHPDYTFIPYELRGAIGQLPVNDIALMELAKPVYAQNVTLPEKNDDAYNLHGLPCRVMGWGRNQDDPNAQVVDRLQETEVFVIERDVCQEYVVYDQVVTDNVLCAGLLEEGEPRGSAKGDSGGPLVVEIDDRWKQIGIMSWGFGVTKFEQPAVYEKVSAHVDWIRGILGKVTSTFDAWNENIVVETHDQHYIIRVPDELEGGTYQVFNMDGTLTISNSADTHSSFMQIQKRNFPQIWSLNHPSGIFTRVLP